MQNNNRHSQRVNSNLSIQISFGSQITLTGQLKDLSQKSAFILIKNSIGMALHDELTFTIEVVSKKPETYIQGTARISRLSPGEGIAIYFIKMEEQSTHRLQKLINTNPIN